MDKEKIFKLFYDRKFDFFKVEMKLFIEKLENYSLMSNAKRQLLFRFEDIITTITIPNETTINEVDDKVYTHTPASTNTSIKKKIFTRIEIEAIMNGVNKHGVGNWVLKLLI